MDIGGFPAAAVVDGDRIAWLTQRFGVVIVVAVAGGNHRPAGGGIELPAMVSIAPGGDVEVGSVVAVVAERSAAEVVAGPFEGIPVVGFFGEVYVIVIADGPVHPGIALQHLDESR